MPAPFQALALEHPARQRLGLEQQRRVGGHDDVAMQPRLLQHAVRAFLAHRDDLGVLQVLAHRGLRRRVRERPGADRVDEHRHALLVRDRHLAQVGARVGVVQDAAAAQDQHVEALHFRDHLGARQPAHRHGALDLVALLRVLGIAGENGDLDLRNVLPQLGDHGLQDGLIAEVQPPV